MFFPESVLLCAILDSLRKHLDLVRRATTDKVERLFIRTRKREVLHFTRHADRTEVGAFCAEDLDSIQPSDIRGRSM